MEVWTKDHPFPIDIDYMISDTLELLRPKMRLSGSLEEATKQVADLEREVLFKLGKSRAACVRVCCWCCSRFCRFGSSRSARGAAFFPDEEEGASLTRLFQSDRFL